MGDMMIIRPWSLQGMVCPPFLKWYPYCNLRSECTLLWYARLVREFSVAFFPHSLNIPLWRDRCLVSIPSTLVQRNADCQWRSQSDWNDSGFGNACMSFRDTFKAKWIPQTGMIAVMIVSYPGIFHNWKLGSGPDLKGGWTAVYWPSACEVLYNLRKCFALNHSLCSSVV